MAFRLVPLTAVRPLPYRPNTRMKRKYYLKDFIGKRYGQLTVTGEVSIPYKNTTRYRFVCSCSCGKEGYLVDPNLLVTGKRKTCGHYHHHLGDTDINNVWRAMKRRCYYEKDINYSRYGGRGIGICEDWKNDFMTFYRWAIENGYKKGLQIDRIDNNGDYAPENCRWVSPKVNSNNRRSNHLLTYDGITLNIQQWSERLGISRETICNRIKYGMPLEKVLNPQIHRKGDIW